MGKNSLLKLLLTTLLTIISFKTQAQWVHTNGPYGGEANALVQSGNNIFACIDGNVFLSSNGGTSWNAISLVNEGVNSMVAGGNEVIAMTGGSGLYLSTDNGVSWKDISNGLPSSNVRTLAISGTNLFASIGSNGVRQPGYGIYRSTNNGASWTAANNGLTNTDVSDFAISVNKSGDTSIFAGTDRGVFLSTNNGLSWSSIGLTSIGITALATFTKGDTTRIIVGTSTGVFLLTNKGSSWDSVNTGLPGPLVNAIAISADSSGGANIFVGTQEGSVYLSNDNGLHWNASSNGLLIGSWDWGASIRSLIVNGPNVFACTSAGIFLSTDYGNNWVPVNNGIPFVNVNALAVTSNGTGNATIFAGTFPSGVFLSTNNGSQWIPVNTGINTIDFNTLAVVGKDVFAGGSTGVFLSTNNGASWDSAGLTNIGEVVCLLSVLDTIGFTDIFAGTWNGTYVSTDNGRSWLSTGLSYNATALAACSNDSGGMDIFAATNGAGVFLSTDKGTSWKAVNTGFPFYLIGITSLFSSGNNVFIGTSGNGIFVSTNHGANWNSTSLTTSANTWISCFTASPNGATGTNIFAGAIGEGLLVSTDNGATWRAANTGLTDSNVVSLVISGANLFAGTGHGVWRRPISELTSVAEKPSVQIPQQYSLFQNYPNPFNPTTVISYQLPVNTLVTLKVYDELGRLIKTLLEDRQTAGKHSVFFNASNLSSGVYFYRLAAGSFVNTKKLMVIK